MATLEQLPLVRGLAVVNVLEYALRPRGFALRYSTALGRTFRLRGFGMETILTSNPEHIRRIFAADSDTLGTASAASLGRLLWPRSVLVTSGAVHKKQRKLLSPPVTGARLRAFGRIMQELADRRVAELSPGQRFRALDVTTAFTLDVILRTVFGVGRDERDHELRAMLHALVHEIPRVAVFLPHLQKPWFPPFARYLRVQRRFDAWLKNKLDERRRRAEPGEDVLSLLLAARYDDGSPLDDAEIRDQLLTLLLAGHETTSVALATCLERIHRHPDVLERLKSEVQTISSPEDAQRLPYLSAVIDENLRIDPIVTDVSRIPKVKFALDEELVVGPRDLVLVLIEALHHDPELYPEPSRFRPERFLERRPAPHEFAPFGGGVRRCLGAAFSDYETKIMLAALLRQTSLRLLDARPERRVRRNVTMGPARGVAMQVIEAP